MDITLTVYVQPGAKKSQVVGMHGSTLKISLNAPPVEGKANSALLAFLAEKLKLKIKQLTLIRGEKSRTKTISLHYPLKSALTKEKLIEFLLQTI